MRNVQKNLLSDLIIICLFWHMLIALVGGHWFSLSTRVVMPIALTSELVIIYLVFRYFWYDKEISNYKRSVFSSFTILQQFIIISTIVVAFTMYHYVFFSDIAVGSDVLTTISYSSYAGRVIPVVRANFINPDNIIPPMIELTSGLIPFVFGIPYYLGFSTLFNINLVGVSSMLIMMYVLCHFPLGTTKGQYLIRLCIAMLCTVLITLSPFAADHRFFSIAISLLLLLHIGSSTGNPLRQIGVTFLGGVTLSWIYLNYGVLAIFFNFVFAISVLIIQRKLYALWEAGASFLGFISGFYLAGYHNFFSIQQSISNPNFGGVKDTFTFPLFSVNLTSALADNVRLIIFLIATLYVAISLWKAKKEIILTISVFFSTVFFNGISVPGFPTSLSYPYASALGLLNNLRDYFSYSILCYATLATGLTVLKFVLLGQSWFSLRQVGMNFKIRVIFKTLLGIISAYLISSFAWLHYEARFNDMLAYYSKTKGRSVLAYSKVGEINDHIQPGQGIITPANFANILALHTSAVPLVFSIGHTPLNIDLFYNTPQRRIDESELYKTEDIHVIYNILQKYKTFYVLLDNHYDYSETSYLKFGGAEKVLESTHEGWTLLKFPKEPPKQKFQLHYFEPTVLSSRPGYDFVADTSNGYTPPGATNIPPKTAVSFVLPESYVINTIGLRVLDNGRTKLDLVLKTEDKKFKISHRFEYGDFPFQPSFGRIYWDIPMSDNQMLYKEIELTCTEGNPFATIDQIVIVEKM